MIKSPTFSKKCAVLEASRLSVIIEKGGDSDQMTVYIKTPYDEKRLAAEEFHHKLSTITGILIILAGCFGFGAIVAVTTMYSSTIFTNPLSSEEEAPTNIDLGSLDGFVMSSEGLPISGALLHVYKHTGLIDSADKNPGYSTSVITKSDGSYSYSIFWLIDLFFFKYEITGETNLDDF